MFAQLYAKNRDNPNTLTPFFGDCRFMNAFLQYYYASLGNKQYHIAYLHICGWSIMDLHKRIKGMTCRYLKGQLVRFFHILSWLRSKGLTTKKTQDFNNVISSIYIPESLQYIFFYFFYTPTPLLNRIGLGMHQSYFSAWQWIKRIKKMYWMEKVRFCQLKYFPKKISSWFLQNLDSYVQSRLPSIHLFLLF